MAGKKGMAGKTVEQRFWEKVNKLGGFPDFTDPLVRLTRADGECWIWTASTSRLGYGYFGLRGKVELAHRVRLWLDGIETPKGSNTDHLCRRPSCVRHLEVVTPKTNSERSNSPTAINGRKTHCNEGHKFTPENTVKTRNGRGCKACKIEYARVYWEQVTSKKKKTPRPVPAGKHGTPSGYSTYRCGCTECRKAWTGYVKQKRLDRKVQGN